MILSDSAILAAIEAGDIELDPFDRERLGSNSYDVTLAPTLLAYEDLRPEPRHGGRLFFPGARPVLDVQEDNPAVEVVIPDTGLVLEPGQLYLGVTQEWTLSRRHCPMLEGKSSLARLGVWVHVTAGVGDVGFAGRWTLEMVVVRPVRVYAGMPVAQLMWHEVTGLVLQPYDQKASAKYANDRAAPPRPVPSAMWRNFPRSGDADDPDRPTWGIHNDKE